MRGNVTRALPVPVQPVLIRHRPRACSGRHGRRHRLRRRTVGARERLFVDVVERSRGGRMNTYSVPPAHYVKDGFEYRDQYVMNDGTGRDGLVLFRRPLPVAEAWVRVEIAVAK